MNKEPFIINMDESSLPNLAKDGGENYGFVFDKTNEWDKKDKIVPLLVSINEKLDKILLMITENGRE